MEWRVFLATFSAVILAELADKTQLVGITMSSKSGKPLVVWLGSVSAYMLVTLLTVLIGAALGSFIKPEIIRYIGGIVFVGMGVLMLMGKL